VVRDGAVGALVVEAGFEGAGVAVVGVDGGSFVRT